MTSQPTLHRRPIRGFIWGLVFGLGTTGLLMTFALIPLNITNLILYPVVIAVAGTLWGLFGPAKKPKGPAPAGYTPPAAAPEAPAVADETPETEASMDDAEAGDDNDESMDDDFGDAAEKPG
jgi:hypothetical protein